MSLFTSVMASAHSPVESLWTSSVANTTDVKVSWHRPASTTASLMYTLLCRRADQEDALWVKECQEKDINSATITNLWPYTLYEAKVLTRGVVSGIEVECKPIRFRTTPLPPSTPPSTFEARAIETDSITVAWSEPQYPNGPIIKYCLFWDSGPDTDYTEVNLPGTVLTYTARHLSPGHQYRFEVCAGTSLGEGPATDVLIITTKESVTSRFNFSGQAQQTQADQFIAPQLKKQLSISGRPSAAVPVLKPEADPRGKLKSQPSFGKTFSVVVPQPTGTKSSAQTSQTAEQRQQQGQGSIQSQGKGHLGRVQAAGLSTTTSEAEQSSSTAASSTSDGAARSSEAASKPSVGFSTIPRKKKPQTTAQQAKSDKGDEFGFGVPGSEFRLKKERGWTDSVRKKYRAKHRPALDLGAPLSKGVGVHQSVGVPLEADHVLESIKGMAGTIRGKRHGVRAKLEVLSHRGAVLQDEHLLRVYEQERNGCITIYTSSVAALRERKQQCEDIKRVFYNLRLKVTYKDIALDAQLKTELEKRMPGATVPQVFVNGIHFGDHKRIMELNETLELRELLQGFEERGAEECATCGGFGYVPCTWCQGSKRSIANPFEKEDLSKRALKCTVCNENALMRCPSC
eukprot:m.274297 g.274297  ORF g.274297 m.274297 type:complete len:628 (+) comp15686_c1_seq22:513-2396(+)